MDNSMLYMPGFLSHKNDQLGYGIKIMPVLRGLKNNRLAPDLTLQENRIWIQLLKTTGYKENNFIIVTFLKNQASTLFTGTLKYILAFSYWFVTAFSLSKDPDLIGHV